MSSSKTIKGSRVSLIEALEIRLCKGKNIKRRKSLIMRKVAPSSKDTLPFPLEEIAEYKKELMMIQEGIQYFKQSLLQGLEVAYPLAGPKPQPLLNDQEPQRVEQKLYVPLQKFLTQKNPTITSLTNREFKVDKFLKPLRQSKIQRPSVILPRDVQHGHQAQPRIKTHAPSYIKGQPLAKSSISQVSSMQMRSSMFSPTQEALRKSQNSVLKPLDKSVFIPLEQLPLVRPIPVKFKSPKRNSTFKPLKTRPLR